MSPPSALADLARLRAPATGALFASAGELYGDAVFGRDSLEAAEDVVHLRPDVSRDVVLTLARLQGTVDAGIGRDSNEEEPGKIHHEHRSLHIGGRRISARSQELLEDLSARWGGDGTSLTYYGAADATPLFVRLVARHCELHGPSLLDAGVVRGDGAAATVRDCVLAAAGWITRRMDDSPLGLVEFRRRNPNGIPFQVWKDSGTSYLHRDGRVANWDGPIAAVEVQGYAHDALTGAAGVLGDRHPALAAEWRARARALRDRLVASCWMPADDYFAMGLDRDGEGGRARQIGSVASNGALLLDTSALDGLPDADRYVGGIVRRICSSDFLTEVGVRCRALREDGLVDFQDYHGTWAVWMKETFDVVRGLRRQGFPRLALEVGTRLLNAVNVAGANVEFLYVSPDQRVHYDFRERDRRGPAEEIAATNLPEEGQAWTVTAALALKWLLGADRWPPHPAPPPSRRVLEAEVLRELPPARLLRTGAEVRAAYERRGDFAVNREVGAARDRAARARRSW